VLLGAGGTAREVIDLVAARARMGPADRIVAILDDDPSRVTGTLHGIPITGGLGSAHDFPDEFWFVDTLGSPHNYLTRPERIGSLGIAEGRFATLVHPAAAVSDSATLGAGSLVLAFAAIGADVRLGAHVTLLPGATVSHDSEVDDWSVLATGVIVSGSARVGRCCYLGAGAVLIDGCSVGAGALVGMGSVVLRDVPPGAVVAGNPAKAIRPERLGG
jgi:sugar O-acyltransferase (sialic acid O-acetyltransferase NeuD family)